MKFAYLIMAHNNAEQLKLLIKALDYPENDIYLHIDKKSNELDFEVFQNCTASAKIYVYSRYKVYWADLSQTKCQFFLLTKAVCSYHDYYHLISGADFPIKRHKDIIRFFQSNAGNEFVHFESYQPCKKETCTTFHFFQGKINRTSNKYIRKVLGTLETCSITVQKKLGIQRTFYCGANWFSITHKLASELVSNQKRLIKKVRFTICSDEFVLQTYLMSEGDITGKSKSEENNYQSIMRAIDWQRGTPYIWKKQDYRQLIESEYLFARKFDEKVDRLIINQISDYLTDEK